MKSILSIILFSLISCAALGQIRKIQGVIYDVESHNPIPFANFTLYSGSSVLVGTATDFDGRYRLEILDHDTLTIKINAVGYETLVMERFPLGDTNSWKVDFYLPEITEQMEEIKLLPYYKDSVIPDEEPPMLVEIPIHRIPKQRASKMPVYKPPPNWNGYLLVAGRKLPKKGSGNRKGYALIH